MKNIIIILIVAAFFCSCEKEIITTETLLKEIIDRDALAQWPEPYYSCAQFSSYDRNSVAPDKPGWFDNMDKSQFIRTDTNNGRREFVLLDADGPGAIVRFWTTIAGYQGDGILRIYLDGNEQPVIEGDILKLISGGQLIKESPLATSVATETPYLQRGHNFYFPIPYARHCKITYESEGIIEPGAQAGEGFFYNINYRTYDKDVQVKSFTKDDINHNIKLIDQVVTDLDRNNLGKVAGKSDSINISETLAAGEMVSKELKGSKAIRQLSVKINADSVEQALRSCVFEVSFDGEQTIWCPVGDFFGIGYKLSPFTTRYSEVDADGNMTAYWVMPFENDCTFKIINLGNQSVSVQAAILFDDWSWNDRSMHFGATWSQQTGLDTGKSPFDGVSDKYDLNYVTLEGQGVLVGTSVVLFNTVNAWWGEGDEKVYVDGEQFPSHFGTGTEDYYGYAWGMSAPFSHPYIAQPDGSGDQMPGYVSNIRFRGLDAIPFKKSLKFDMEMWHWARTIINHAPTAFWYGKRGTKAIIEPQVEEAKHPVMLEKPERIRIVHDGGPIEGEDMFPVDPIGFIGTQTIKGLGWSNDTQMMWTGTKPGDELTLSFVMKEGGSHNISLRLTQSHDYGIVSVALNGKMILPSFDGYSTSVKSISIPCGVQSLKKGDNILKVKVSGKDYKAIENFFGLDCIELH